MNKRYIGITIGPIFDTICDATSPAALWFSSFFFSNITKKICEKLCDSKELGEVVIYSPYYDKEISLSDGVGKFHDRIICSVSEYRKEVLDKIVDEVKIDMVEAFPREKMHLEKSQIEEFLKSYLQILYVVKEDIEQENCILELSPYLDAIELIKTVPKVGTINVFQKLFMGDLSGENKNVNIKESDLYLCVDNHQLKRKDGNIKSIEEIAMDEDSRLKYQKYFAVINADGDNMGNILKSLKSDDEILGFSKLCLEYAEKASELIKNYGGITIYAGGDDLLFLAPVQHRGKTIFDLCKEINTIFVESFSVKYKELIENSCNKPTVSFGVSVQYYKYPLYEAINNSRKLLWHAKDVEKNPKKNCIAFNLQKHSGQSVDMIISNNDLDKINELLVFGNDAANVQSVMYAISDFRTLFELMDKNAKEGTKSEEGYQNYEKIWCNLFDNACQEYAMEYIKGICRIYYFSFLFEQEQEESLNKLFTILKIKKFLVEKEGDK